MKKIALILMTCVLVLAGCQGEPPVVEPERVESDGTYVMTQHIVGEINFFDVRRRDSVKQPIVILQHGLAGQKEDMISYAKYLADKGYYAVVPDAAAHGENTVEEEITFTEMLKRTATGYDKILEYYNGDEFADNQNFALTGMSMGGMTALSYGAYGTQTPKCIVSLYATPSWEGMLNSNEIYVMSSNGTLVPIQDEEKKKQESLDLINSSPDNNLENLLRIPILMINGDSDELIPISSVETFKVKASLFENKLETVVNAGQGHDMAEGDVEKMVEFLNRYLVK